MFGVGCWSVVPTIDMFTVLMLSTARRLVLVAGGATYLVHRQAPAMVKATAYSVALHSVLA